MTRDRQELMKDIVLTQTLRELPARVPPPSLRASLRVIAARERQRLLAPGITWRDRLNLFISNLARPLALPFAGGVFTTVILFSMWLVPAYPLHGDYTFDVPTMLTTEATVTRVLPIDAGGSGDVVVDVTVDGQGRMVDYEVVSGRTALNSEALRINLVNRLLFTEFKPATSFGQPTLSKLRLYLRTSQIDVKG